MGAFAKLYFCLKRKAVTVLLHLHWLMLSSGSLSCIPLLEFHIGRRQATAVDRCQSLRYQFLGRNRGRKYAYENIHPLYSLSSSPFPSLFFLFLPFPLWMGVGCGSSGGYKSLKVWVSSRGSKHRSGRHPSGDGKAAGLISEKRAWSRTES